MIIIFSERETNIVSVERLREYSEDIPMEAPEIIEDRRPPENWPLNGCIQYKAYSMRYRKNLPLVLRGLDLSIEGQQKIGIVGRTGAGKSTMLTSLLRLVEPCGGSIFVDDLNIHEIGLFDLRSKFSIIPQDPGNFKIFIGFYIL